MRVASPLVFLSSTLLLVSYGCGDDVGDVAPGLDGSVDDAGSNSDAGVPPFGGLVADTPHRDFDIDLFDGLGHRFWVQVSDDELARMNRDGNGPGPIFFREFEWDQGDIYSPGSTPTFADHVLVKDVKTGKVADFGKVEVKLVGESTYRPFSRRQIPNLRFDFDEFELGKRLGGFEHIRLNNSLVGTIFRESLAHRIYRALGYPALRSSHAFLGSNVWGHGVWIPMTLIEVYKPRFCLDNAERIGGKCKNMWEFAGDLGDTMPQRACQWMSCDDTRLEELHVKLRRTPVGPGFKTRMSEFIDWSRMHEFQCLSWMLGTGDDPIHNANNNLIIEREDGRLLWAPYSVDISAGQSWYPYVPLTGSSRLARGCQLDAQCWADTVETCERLIEAFDALDPETLVEELADQLMKAGMLRGDDVKVAMELRDWYAERQTTLLAELERFRFLPDALGRCPEGLDKCNDGQSCGTAEQCEEWRCAIGQHFCDALDSCIPRKQECYDCEGDDTVYCPVTGSCEVSMEACSAYCDLFLGEGAIYCPSLRGCAYEWECDGGGIDLDGGLDPKW